MAQVKTSVNAKEVAKNILSYKVNVIAKINNFLSLLADEGIQVADHIIQTAINTPVGYSPQTGDYDYLGANSAQKTVVSKVGKGRYSVAVEYSGKDVMFIEFSAGITYGTQTFPKFSNGDTYGDGYGVGTYPGQTHAFDQNGWFYSGGGEVFRTYGNKAYMPLYHAGEEMLSKIAAIATVAFA